jgi:hypothetical protein
MGSNRVIRTLRAIFGLPYIRKVEYVESMSSIPPERSEVMYIVRNGGKEKWAVFSCPCEIGERIDVNLMATRFPHWTILHRADGVTLFPSLRMPKDGCNSHFWIKASRVVWAETNSISVASKLFVSIRDAFSHMLAP